MSQHDVEVAVIGRGMIGSAAARHLAESGVSVALIGSGEPADYAQSTNPFSSHYDAGRITRISSASTTWAEVAARSIRRYRHIEERSGIGFHDPRGLAQASATTEASVANAIARGGDARVVDRSWLRATTGIAIRDDHPGDLFFEGPPAGVINPRRLVAAQTALATAAGATVIENPAAAVRRKSNGFAIDCGPILTARRIVLATGAYGAQLVNVELAIERRLRTIVLSDVGRGDSIPSLIDDAPGHPDIEGIYWVPPVDFPDGRRLLKIGGNSLPMITASSNDEIGAWFRAGGSDVEARALRETVEMLLPDTPVATWDHRPCVVTYTATERPFLGFIDDDVVVALGASGSGAKSSDELGRLAATLVTPEGWTDPDLDLDLFEPVLA